MKKAILLSICLLSSPAMSHAFMASNGLRVQATGQSSFEVPYRGLSGTPDFWCAAGEYVIRRLHMSPGTTIYRTSSGPRRAGQGISFSLDPEGAKSTGLFTFGNQRGISASHARHICQTQRLQRRDFD